LLSLFFFRFPRVERLNITAATALLNHREDEYGKSHARSWIGRPSSLKGNQPNDFAFLTLLSSLGISAVITPSELIRTFFEISQFGAPFYEGRGRTIQRFNSLSNYAIWS
jgi:hypothetical protein